MTLEEYYLSLATDQRKGPAASAVKAPLFLLSLVYGLAMRSLAFFYGLRPFSSPLKVISVGNITLGGTGKTMLVEHICRLLAMDGRRVAVLSRGYKRAGAGPGDEPGMLKKKFPSVEVIVGPDRVRSLRQAAGRGAQVAVIDDGFQQWRIRKDLDIVCVDARGFGNRSLIPRGMLREPVSALARASIFVVTNSSLAPAGSLPVLKAYLRGLNPRAPVVEADHEPQGVYRAGDTGPVPAPAKAALVCGIGNPDSFFACCRRIGVSGPEIVFPDHHRFTPADIARIASVCGSESVTAVVTTEKDEMRLPAAELRTRGLELYVLRAAVRFTQNEQELTGRLRGIFPA